MFSQLRANLFSRNATSTGTRLNSSAPFIFTSGGWHYNSSTINMAYYHNCACLDLPGPAAGADPVLDNTQVALACDGTVLSQCKNRGFLVYKLA
jgi:hypothetical protein